MKTNVKKVSIFGLAAAFILSLIMALFTLLYTPAGVTASAESSAKITNVTWTAGNGGGYVHLYTDISSSTSIANINSNAYLGSWRYQKITVNGVQAVSGGAWDNTGYFNTANNVHRYQLWLGNADVAADASTVAAASDGNKYLNYILKAGSSVGGMYTISNDVEFTVVLDSSNAISGAYKTARITQVVSQSNDNSYYWYQFHTNILGSATATNKDHNNYLTPWRTTKMVVNGSAVVSGGDFYYAGGFRNDESRRNYNEDGTAGNLYYVWMTGIPKSSINKLSDKKIKIELLQGRRLGDEYIFGYKEDIVIDYSNGTSEHSLPITGASVTNHQANAGNGTYEVFVNVPGVTDFKPYTNTMITSIRSAIKVDGKELSSEEKNMTYFTGGKLKISGKSGATGAFAPGEIHEVVIPVGTKFESQVSVSVSAGIRFVEGYTNRTLEEELRFYVYQNNNGEFQVSSDEANIEVESDPYLDAHTNVGSIVYTEGKGWKITGADTAADSGCYRFMLKKGQTAAAIAAGCDKLTLTFGGAFDGAATGNPVNCKVWFMLPSAGNGNLAWLGGGYISGLTSNGNGTYSYTIDLTNAAYDFVNYDIVIRVTCADVAGKTVNATYLHAITYSESYKFNPASITMLDGASVRMKNPTGLGFTTRIDKAAYDEAVAICGAENVKVGTLITPTDYLTCDFTIEALNANGIMYKNIPNEGWLNEETIEKDGYYAYRGSLAPVKEYNYNRNFSAVGYLAYTVEGKTTYVYTEYREEDHSRSVAYVAKAAYEDVYKEGIAKDQWLRPASDEPNTLISYTEGKGWKVTATTSYYNFYLKAEVIDSHIAQGATSLTITAGGSFDGTSHAGAPVNCQAWIIPKNSAGSDDWSFKAGYISGWTSIGNGKYSYTIDLTNANYKFAGNDIRFRINSLDVNSRQVGACYLYGIEFDVAEKDGSKYPYPTLGGYSPYTAEELKILETYIPFDSTVTAEYKIVKPSAATATETTAANMMQEYLQNSLGVTCEVVSDGTISKLSSYSKYISIGQTSLLEDAGFATLAEDNVDYDGYVIKTMGSILFIDGILDRGTLYGVMDFAEENLGYVFIDGECTVIGAVDSLKVEDVEDSYFTPYMETRSYLEYDVTKAYTDPLTAVARKSNNYYLGNVSSYGSANYFGYWGTNEAHTMQATLEKGIELDGGTKNIANYAYRYTANSATHYQPCLTNETTKALMANAMKELIKEKYNSGIRYYALTQEDSPENKGYCTCSTCASARTTYGGQSGVTLKFLNDIVAILNSDAAFKAQYPDYKLYTFAYQYTLDHPTVSNTVIKACDKVSVMVCPSASNYMKDLFDSTNSETKTALNGWSKYCEDLMVWMYDANFTNYVEYHPTLTGVIADNVYKLKKIGVNYIMINGAYNGDYNWDDKLRAYVYSELLYDFDEAKYKAGADAYVNEIVAKYLAAYYGEYADEVQSIIDLYQSEVKDKALSGNSSLAEELDIATVQEIEALIDGAIADNTDEVMEKRLYAIKASVCAMYYEREKSIFGTWNNSTKKAELKEACNKAGITMWSETQTIADKFGS